jgi:hypothetical protein
MKRWCRGSLGGCQAGRVEIIAVPWLRSPSPGGGAARRGGAGGRLRAASILPERSARGGGSGQNSDCSLAPPASPRRGVQQLKSSRTSLTLVLPYTTTTSSSSQTASRLVSASQGRCCSLQREHSSAEQRQGRGLSLPPYIRPTRHLPSRSSFMFVCLDGRQEAFSCDLHLSMAFQQRRRDTAWAGTSDDGDAGSFKLLVGWVEQ